MNRNLGAIRWLWLAIIVVAFSAASFSQIAVGISVRIGPPPLPVYAQPICPGPGYFWPPGYWAWNDEGGCNYGFGYTGVGFVGGEWRGREFFYNRSVMNVSVTNVTNVYNRTVIVNNTRNVSFNGRGGVEARPTSQEERFSREPHNAALAAQTQHEHAARQNRQLFASENHGRPAIAATAKPAEVNGPHVQPARAAGAPYRAPKITPQEARGQAPGNRGGNRTFNDTSRNVGNGNAGGRVAARPGNDSRNNNPR